MATFIGGFGGTTVCMHMVTKMWPPASVVHRTKSRGVTSALEAHATHNMVGIHQIGLIDWLGDHTGYKKVRSCDTCKLSNDPEGVIWNEVKKLNWGIVVGPKVPHSLMKDITKLYLELAQLTDKEKVTNLMHMMSQYVAKNFDLDGG